MAASLTGPGERRAHPRAPAAPGRPCPAARLRTGSPLRVLDASPDGMLVESPARLLPGRQVDLVLQNGATQEQTPWVVVHSRVGCIRGSSDLRYRAGLRRAAGSSYSRRQGAPEEGNALPTTDPTPRPRGLENGGDPCRPTDGIQFGSGKRA
jgi:hypothetical protein